MNQPNLPNTNRANHSRLGMSFERELEATHSIYAARKIATIEKNPVEWKHIGRGEYDKMASSSYELVATTNLGRYLKRMKSDVDFSGVVKGRFITFDAKETKEKSLPLSNIEKHQIDTLVQKEKCGGISGLMIRFSSVGRVFFLPASEVDKALIEMLYKRGRKSIPIADCEVNGIEIPVQQNFLDWYSVLVK